MIQLYFQRNADLAPAAADPADVSGSGRSILDAIASRNTPIAPGADPDGVLLADIAPRGCRFPISRDHLGTRFCAVEIGVGTWRPGSVNGCYCAFHREFLAGAPRANWEDM